ncbi:MAG: tetratricopeptide repeat protein [Cyanobacteria bacterium J06592_8]
MSDPISSEHSSEAAAYDFYQQAELYLSQGNTEAATALYQQSIQLNPNFSWSYYNLGEAFYQQAKWKEAISAYHQAIQLNPNFSWSYYNLGNSYSELGQFSEAISAYSQAINLDLDLTWSFYKLGLALSQEQRWSEAILAYFKAIQKRIDCSDIYIKLQEAIQSSELNIFSDVKCLQVFSEDLETCLKIARNLSENSNFRWAVEFYNLVLKQHPQHSEALVELDLIKQIDRRSEKQLKSCYDGIKLAPNSHKAYYNLGVCLSQQQRWEEASVAYLKAIELKSEVPTWVYQGLWEYLAKQGKLKVAENIYRKAVEQNPHSIWCYVNLGEILTQKGEQEEAIQCYKAAGYQKIKQFHPDWLQDIEKLKPVQQPNFIVIGTQKGGTTSLYYYLAKHPQIMPSLIKEIDFWSTKYQRGLDWYLAHFPPRINQNILSGEATPSYLDHRDAAERLFQVFPKTKLIVVLRNPIDRAISHYYQWIEMNWESRSIEEAMMSELEKFNDPNPQYWNQPNSYIARGIYVEFLKKWLEIFPREQIFIMGSEVFYANPVIALEQIFKFLGLSNYPLAEYQKYNTRSYPNVDPSIHNLLGNFFKIYNQQLEDLLKMKFNWENN